MSLLVYAVVAAASRIHGRGIAGEPLRVVRAGRLGAVVGDATLPRSGSAAPFAAYNDVLQRLVARRVTVVPVLIGATQQTLSELEALLRQLRGHWLLGGGGADQQPPQARLPFDISFE